MTVHRLDTYTSSRASDLAEKHVRVQRRVFSPGGRVEDFRPARINYRLSLRKSNTSGNRFPKDPGKTQGKPLWAGDCQSASHRQLAPLRPSFAVASEATVTNCPLDRTGWSRQPPRARSTSFSKKLGVAPKRAGRRACFRLPTSRRSSGGNPTGPPSIRRQSARCPRSCQPRELTRLCPRYTDPCRSSGRGCSGSHCHSYFDGDLTTSRTYIRTMAPSDLF
jgi:hypothetical protein